jgi:hypothetical protein
MLCLVRTKACKRCGGDLSLECDIYGVYAECIQCGATWSKKVLIPPTTQKVRERQKVETAKPSVVARYRRDPI